MSALLLLVYPVALILGGMLLGWLARWYRYGGRCGPGGLKDGIPNIDADRGTVALDGTEPVATAGTRRAKAAEDARAALGSLRAGYADGKRADAPSTIADGSPAARIGALADVPPEPADGSIAARVGAVAGGAVASVKDVAASAADGTKSLIEPLRDGTAKDRIAETTTGAVEAVKDRTTGAVEGTKSGLAAMKGGYVEGKTPGETPDTPADGSVLAKVGAAVGGAVASVTDAAASVTTGTKPTAASAHEGMAEDHSTETADSTVRVAKDTASGALDDGVAGSTTVRGNRVESEGSDRMAASPADGVATTEDRAEGRAPGETPDTPADGSVFARVGAAVGGAVAATAGAVSGAVDNARSAVSPASKEDEEETVGDTARRAARHDRGLPGAVIGQEEGHVPTATDPAPARPTVAPVDVSNDAEDGDGEARTDTAALRARFAALANEAEDAVEGAATTEDSLPAALDDVEKEARRIIESGEDIARPGNALAAPEQGRAPDDLKRISGVGPRIERTLNDEGIYYFDQIAGFDGRDLAWADRTLGFSGRVVRDRWMPQARNLAGEGASGMPVGYRIAGDASPNAPVNTTLHPVEAEALKLIEREGGYSATSQNRPNTLMRDGPVAGRKDDLKRIKGVGGKLERVLNGLGVYYFRQIAAFSASDIAWVDSKLKFKGRIVRDRWVPQAATFERNRDT